MVLDGLLLNLGVTMEDYKVEVGVGECNVTSLADNLLVCQLPEVLPAAAENHYGTDRTEESDEKLPAVTVIIFPVVGGHEIISFSFLLR